MEKVSKSSRIEGTISIPTSKSYAQRALAAALLVEGTTTLKNMELSDDTRAALSVVESLGGVVESIKGNDYVIRGGVVGGRLRPQMETVTIGESGLSTRMFTPIAALHDQPITIIGHGSILIRPMEMMIEPLESLGVRVDSKGGFLPITVQGPIRGGRVEIDGSISSQLITGLMMALPLAQQDTTIVVDRANSRPYIDMTMALLKNFGVTVEHEDYREFYIAGGQKYQAIDYVVEGDWSSASCLLVAGAIGGEITIENLNSLSIQADVKILDALSDAGAEVSITRKNISVKRRELRPFEFDATQCPDLFPALVALAAHCDGVSTIMGTERLIYKESNRAESLRDVFGRMGIEVDIEQHNVMKVTGGAIKGATVSSHNDHRIAMAAAVAALVSKGEVVITQSEAVDKSYPDFWVDLESVKVK